MALFGKKTPDEEWLRSIISILPAVDETCVAFERTSKAVGADPITGWMDEEETLARLQTYEDKIREARKVYKAAGTPAGEDLRTERAKPALDEFFRAAGLAFHWGKYHYRDASGGPGRRAMSETGIAQTAARARVMRNGTQFAVNARGSAVAGRAAIELIRTEIYGSDGRPPLADLFVEAAEVGAIQKFRESGGLPLAEVAMLGSWCYSRAAILGMVVASSPSPFLAPVWDPEKANEFWRFAEEELATINALGPQTDSGLAYVRFLTGYSELYGGVELAGVKRGNLKQIEKMAESKVPFGAAKARWAVDTALGLGVGMLDPEGVRSRLEAESNPDLASWERAHAAGLNIPLHPDAISSEEQIDTVVSICSAFFQTYYAEASRALSELVRGSPA